jgi:MSHA biogenesis protein MshN
MSVVNKMLQDLEARKQRQTISGDYVPKQPMEPKAKRFGVWGIAGAICIVSVAVVASQLQTTDPSIAHYQPADTRTLESEVVENANNNSDIVEPADTSAQVKTSTSNLDAVPSAIIKDLEEPTLLAQATADLDSSAEEPIFQESMTKQPEPKQLTATPVEEVQPVLATTEEPAPKGSGEFSIAPSNGAIAELSSLREQARVALAEEDKGGAIDALRAILVNYPEDLRAPKQLASILFSQQRFGEAAQVLEVALQRLPSDSSLRMMLSRIAFKTGDIQLAYETLAAHPFERLADIELLSFRAALAERLKHYEHANQDYVLLVGREPRNARWWLGLGVSQDKLAQTGAAIKSYQQAKDLNQLPSQVREFLQERIDILARQS